MQRQLVSKVSGPCVMEGGSDIAGLKELQTPQLASSLVCLMAY